MPTTTGKATDFIQFTRASNATVTDADGKIKWAPHNLLTNSESFDASAWIKSFSSVSSNAAVSPNGQTTADKLVDTTSSNVHSARQVVTVSGGTRYTLAVYAKMDGRRWLVVDPVYPTVANNPTYFDLQNGVVGTNDVDNTATITSIGSGWYLCQVSHTTQAAQTSMWFQVQTANVDGTDVYIGDGSSGIHLWGAHLYRSDLGGMQANTSAYPMYNPTTPRNLLGFSESLDTGWTGTNGGLQASGVELVTNGNFANGLTGWTDTSGSVWSVVSGQASTTSAASDAYLQQTALTVGKVYQITADVVVTSGTLRFYSEAGDPIITTGALRRTFVADTTSLSFRAFAGSTVTIDNISVKEVLFYEAPNGLQTARAVEAAAANATLLSSISLLASPYTFSVWLRRKTGSGNVQLTVDGSTFTTVSVTDTWTRFSTTLTPSAGTKTPGIRLVTSGDAVYAWGAQLSDSASLDAYVPSYGAAVTSAAYYGPRRDFDPVTLACKGLLVEEQRSNLLLRSNELDNASWVKAQATVTANAATSPDGTVTAEKIVEDSTAGVEHAVQQASTTSGSAHTFSVYLKASERSWAVLRGVNSALGNVRAWFNLSTGAVGTVNAGGTATIIAVGGGWYRCALTLSSPATAAYEWRIGVSTGDAVLTYNGDGASGILAYGAQLEAGSFATSYIPTGAATATRSADVASVSTQAFPYSATEGSVVVSFAVSGVDTSKRRMVWTGSDAGNNRLALRALDSAINYPIAVVGTGSSVVSLNGAALTANTPAKIGVAYGSDMAFVQNAGTPQTSASAASVSINNIALGDIGTGANALNGHIRQITYLPRRISNAELQTRTA